MDRAEFEEADRLSRERERAVEKVKALTAEAETLEEAAKEIRAEIKSQLEAAGRDEAAMKRGNIWAASVESFMASEPTPSWSERDYILPFGRKSGKWSPYDVDEAEFGKDWLEDTTALMCLRRDEARSYPTRLIFASGLDLAEMDKIGNQFTARHDQTNAKLGVYEIVGLVFYGEGGDIIRTVGDVPHRKISQNTYK